MFYKVKARIEYIKDENGNYTNEISIISPICGVPFVGKTNSSGDWYFIKTGVTIPETEGIIPIADDMLPAVLVEFNLSEDIINTWYIRGG